MFRSVSKTSVVLGILWFKAATSLAGQFDAAIAAGD
jgi:hypothetical protein